MQIIDSARNIYAYILQYMKQNEFWLILLIRLN